MYWCSLDILFMLHSPQQAHLHLQIILPPTWHGLWKQYFHPANSLFIAYWQSPLEYLFHSHLNHIISCVQNLTSAPCILLCHPLSSPQGSWQGFLQGLMALPSAQSRNITNLSQFNLHSFICALIQEFLPLILIIRMAICGLLPLISLFSHIHPLHSCQDNLSNVNKIVWLLSY